MNEKQKDKGLMKAVKEQPQFRLTSNFTFRTMQKVEEAARLHEKETGEKDVTSYYCCFSILNNKQQHRSVYLFWKAS